MEGMITLLPSTRRGFPWGVAAKASGWEAVTSSVSVEPSGAETTPALIGSRPSGRPMYSG